MKLAEFAKLMASLFVAYGKKSEKETVSVYYQFLKEYDTNVLRNAVTRAIKTEQYFPRIATLKKIIVDELGTVPTEADVMNDLWKAINDYGIYESPHFRFPVTHALVEELCWQTLCNMSPEKVNESIHFRYPSMSKQYKTCLLEGRPFAVNRIKGLFEIQGRGLKRLNGEIQPLGVALKGMTEKQQKDNAYLETNE